MNIDRDRLDRQVTRMLAIAQERHSEFLADCLNDPNELVTHWSRSRHLGFAYVDNLDRGLEASGNTVVDDSEDLSGLFTPAIPPKRKSLIQVKYRKGDYTVRRNFTLLHEIGHYLQQTDDELADALIGGFSIRYEDKLFEEAACNRFASLALLPTDYVLSQIGGGPITAETVSKLFDYERHRHVDPLNVRVSRPVIARRLAAFLPEGGTVTLVDDNSVMRFHQDDATVDYYKGNSPAMSLNETERLLYDEFSLTRSRPHARSLRLQTDDGTEMAVSIARSFGKTTYYFIVTAHVDGWHNRHNGPIGLEGHGIQRH